VERSDTHHLNTRDVRMTGYRRNFVAGGSFFFTVNLADRRLQLLTESIHALRTAFRETQRHRAISITFTSTLSNMDL
jgi:REP element-mobilizing transposase RayT